MRTSPLPTLFSVGPLFGEEHARRAVAVINGQRLRGVLVRAASVSGWAGFALTVSAGSGAVTEAEMVKVLAAQAAGVKTLVLPKLNNRDLAEVPKELKTGIKFHFVEHMREVLDLALLPAKPKGRKV